MKIRAIEKMFQFVVFFQSFVFVIFFIENINTLDEIQIELPDGSTDTLNLYSLLTGVIIVMGIVILASISFFGAGINEEGTKTMGKILFFLVVISLLSLGTSYYMVRLGWVGNVIIILTLLIYGLKGIETLGGES